MINIELEKARKPEGIDKELLEVKKLLEQRLNLTHYSRNIQSVSLQSNVVLRICLMVGLQDKGTREISEIQKLQIATNSGRYTPGFFGIVWNDLPRFITTMIRLRYKDIDIDWSIANNVSRVLQYEALRGRDILMKGNIDDWLTFVPTGVKGGGKRGIPELRLYIGKYGNDNEAYIDINARSIPNTQIVIAGSTGSGKTNLLAVLINQIRSISMDSAYPVNFLLFDYKGEFSDPQNASWLSYFNVNSDCILNPLKQALPFNPFKDLTGKTINEINLYASTLSSALISVFGARVSANMEDMLRSAINKAYTDGKGAPITFADVLKNYKGNDPDRYDTVISSLNQLIDANIFRKSDDIDLMKNSYIVNLGQYPKDGPIAKAIVYFTISKLNNIYETLPVQAKDEERVELRHFTIIDEAHYMLSFRNEPLRNLIAVGRNKGMSIILATQDMESYRNDYFDFYTNAYYPIIMKQQSINNGIISGLFGGDSRETNEIRQAISDLQLGELVIKDNEAAKLGMGKRWKKIKVTHFI